ncbi:MAG: VOC family protein [Pseudomonadota bacterium]
MFDHFGMIVRDAAAALRFYSATMPPLGLRILEQHPNGAFIVASADSGAMQFLYIGPDAPEFWQATHEPSRSPVHICFGAPNRAAVDTFYAMGLATGGTPNGAPGERDPGYYAAYVIDPDGNNIEAAYRSGTSSSEGR